MTKNEVSEILSIENGQCAKFKAKLDLSAILRLNKGFQMQLIKIARLIEIEHEYSIGLR